MLSRRLCVLEHSRRNWLFFDTSKGADASATICSIVEAAKLNGLNQRDYLEWLLAEMPNDDGLGEPGRIDRYPPWSENVPANCRLSVERAEGASVMPDEPIEDAEALEAAP